MLGLFLISIKKLTANKRYGTHVRATRTVKKFEKKMEKL